MLKVVYQRSGEPSKVLEIANVETPSPAGSQVLVKLAMMPIVPADLATIRGIYRTPQKTPTTPGLEGIGVISATGNKVESFAVGQRVLVLPFKNAGWSNGTWQEYVLLDEYDVFPIPDQAEAHVWAQLFNTILTPWIMLVEDLRLKSGDTLLLTGAGSTVGQVALQISKIKGFSVIGVVRRSEQIQLIKELGARDVICSANEDITQRAMALTNLRGVDAVLDAVGGKVASQCLRALADNGTMYVYGLLDLERDSGIDIRKILFYNLSLRGFWLPGWWHRTATDERIRIINTVAGLVAQGHLTAVIDSKFRLSEVKAAVEKAEQPGNNGRVFLIP